MSESRSGGENEAPVGKGRARAEGKLEFCDLIQDRSAESDELTRKLALDRAREAGWRGWEEDKDRALIALKGLKDGAMEQISRSSGGLGAIEEMSPEVREWLFTEAMGEAARQGAVEALLALAALGGDPCRRGGLGENLLLEACAAGQAGAVEELALWGLNVNEADNWGGSALKRSALAGAGLKASLGLGEMYVRRGEPRGFGALDAALRAGARINALSTRGMSALAELCEGGDACEEAVEALLERGADPNIASARHGGLTAWQAANRARGANARVCAALLERGADPALKERDALSAGALAALEAFELGRQERSGTAPRAAGPRL